MVKGTPTGLKQKPALAATAGDGCCYPERMLAPAEAPHKPGWN